jgi:Methylene-tetrahydrofolate reductase C terminal
MYLLQRAVQPNRGYRRFAAWLEARPRLRGLFTAAERGVKQEIFGCRMCGQCALPVTGYACPMTCPKQLRNGPCGGVGADGSCEVFPALRCVWLVAFERAESQGRAADLQRLQRPVDHRLWQQSSWISYWQGRDADLWTDDDGLATPAELMPGGPAEFTLAVPADPR